MTLTIRAPFWDSLTTSPFVRTTLQIRCRIVLETPVKSPHRQHSHKQTEQLGDRHEQGASETYQWIQLQVPRPRLPRNPLEPLPLPCDRCGLHLSRHSTTKPIQAHESTRVHSISQQASYWPKKKSTPGQGELSAQIRVRDGGVAATEAARVPHSLTHCTNQRVGKTRGEDEEATAAAATTHWPLLPLAASCSAALLCCPPVARGEGKEAGGVGCFFSGEGARKRDVKIQRFGLVYTGSRCSCP
jgi:hypothetical protein